MSEVILENIRKTYLDGKVKAINGVSFSVEKGELFGLIGPDGAGKTSLFRILTTLLLPDSGKAFVFGCDIVKDYKTIRQHLGYMPGKFSLYQDLTVEENLNFFATVFGTTFQENYDLIKDIYVQLEPFKTRRAGKLSGGMKQKLALCCALIHRPKVLFLDEPTTGVDTVSRKEFWEMLQRLKEQEITILVSTPYMDEAMLCQRIALIQEGEIMSINTPQGIIKEYPKPLFSIKSSNMIQLLHDLRQHDSIDSCNSFGEYHHISFKSDNTELARSELASYLNTKKDCKNLVINEINPTIEDCFINLMN